MEYHDVYGMTVYAQEVGPPQPDGMLLASLRQAVPTLMDTDPDDYRTTRELVVRSGRLAYAVALGQMRDRTIWYAVMAVGATVAPPPEYLSTSKAVGEAAIELALYEGDFDED